MSHECGRTPRTPRSWCGSSCTAAGSRVTMGAPVAARARQRHGPREAGRISPRSISGSPARGAAPRGQHHPGPLRRAGRMTGPARRRDRGRGSPAADRWRSVRPRWPSPAIPPTGQCSSRWWTPAGRSARTLHAACPAAVIARRMPAAGPWLPDELVQPGGEGRLSPDGDSPSLGSRARPPRRNRPAGAGLPTGARRHLVEEGRRCLVGRTRTSTPVRPSGVRREVP